MSRVILVSNRVTDPNQAAQAGGVAVAIADCLRQRQGIWVGWSGIVDDGAADQSVDRSHPGLATLSLSEAEYRSYYLGYSNSVLWPVFHSRVDLAQFEAGFFAAYQAVNRRFAEALVALIRPDDLIWVHDYHFICLARELRALGVKNKIGFFLHIPFPPSQSFLTIPEHLQLAHAFAAYDLIGLQASTDVAHMIDYLHHGAAGQMLPDGRMRVGDREFSIASFPVGIDAGFFQKLGAADVVPKTARQHARIVGVDRLDYTKGLPQKFRAYGRFLEVYPEFRNRVVLTQIAAPTRESVEAYADIRKELESLSGSINGAYGDLEWVPIHYINQTTSRERLAGIYRDSAVALVTPLRDGMNLVAKEYIAAQNPENPGVLILSRFAGAAEQMPEALIVNPYNVDEIADAIYRAVQMPIEERRRRCASLLENIVSASASQWSSSFLSALTNADPFNDSQTAGGMRLRRAIRGLSGSAEKLPTVSDRGCIANVRPQNSVAMSRM